MIPIASREANLCSYANCYMLTLGKVVERKLVRDMLDFYEQLGVIEYTEKAKKLFPEKAT